MANKSSTRTKLEQARFFIGKASETMTADRRAFVNLIEAAIVFARSVTFCLQSEYRDTTEFKDWYLEKQEEMKKDPLFSFFRDRRNYILKEGSAGVHKGISLNITEHAGISEFFEIKVTRGRPWYRRSPKILWEDLRAAIKRPIRRWIWTWKNRRQHKKSQKETQVEASEGFYFDDPMWKDRKVCDLLQEYVNKLDWIVSEAEIKFGKKSS